MSIQSDADYRDAIDSDNRTSQDKPVVSESRLPLRLVSSWGSTVLMAFVIAGGMLGLTRFACHLSQKDQTLATAFEGGGGIIVRSEVLHIWLPPTLIELAKCQLSSGVIRTHDDLKQFLELRGQEKLWYAMTRRAHQSNGEIVDMPFVRQPYREPDSFGEFLMTLAEAAANSSDGAPEGLSSGSFHLLTEEFVKCEVRDVMAELKRHPYSLVGLERREDSGGE